MIDDGQKEALPRVLRAALRGALAYAPAMAPDHREWFLWLCDPTCLDCGGLGSVGGSDRTVTGCVTCGGCPTDPGTGRRPQPSPPGWVATDPQMVLALEIVARGEP